MATRTGDIVLSQALRANLASLLSTQSLIEQTQARLSTGKKVNSALDNPLSFFAASALSSRSDALRELVELIEKPVERFQDTGKIETLFHELQKTTNHLDPMMRFVLVMIIWQALFTAFGDRAAAPVQELLVGKASLPSSQALAAGQQARLEDYRFAMSEGVRVRNHPNTEAENVATLHRGQVVKVLDVHDGWLFGSLKNGDAEVTGWIYPNTLGKAVSQLDRMSQDLPTKLNWHDIIRTNVKDDPLMSEVTRSLDPGQIDSIVFGVAENYARSFGFEIESGALNQVLNKAKHNLDASFENEELALRRDEITANTEMLMKYLTEENKALAYGSFVLTSAIVGLKLRDICKIFPNLFPFCP